MKCLYSALSVLTIVMSCGGNDGDNVSSSHTYIPAVDDSILIWKEWAESTDDGLWVSEQDRAVYLSEIKRIGGDDSAPFFNPGAMAVVQKSLFVADRANESLVCVDVESGELQWSVGSSGEGPGHFSQIGHIAFTDERVFVGNSYNSRVDVFSRDGIFLESITIMFPYDIAVVNDTLLVVLSLFEHNLINLFHTQTLDNLGAFGEWETDLTRNLVISNRNLFICTVGDSCVAVSSFFESVVRIFDVHRQQLVDEFYRNTPINIAKQEEGQYSVHIADICTFEDSIICVALPPITNNGEPIVTAGDMDDLASITIVDRYNSSGEYLDSFIIPGNAVEITIEDSRLYASNPLDGSIRIYDLASATD